MVDLAIGQEFQQSIVAAGWRRSDQGSTAEPVIGTIARLVMLTFPDNTRPPHAGYRLGMSDGDGVQPGYSGGPVIDPATGRGIAVLRMRKGDDAAYATAIGELRHWRAEVTPAEASPDA